MGMKTVVAQMQHYHNLQFGDLEWEWRQATLPQLTVWWLGMGMKTIVAQMQHYHNLQFGDLGWEWRQL